MADPAKKIYWDSCAWIGFFNNEPDKVTPLRVIWGAAEKGKYEIYTSTFSYVEVIHGKQLYGQPYPPEDYDAKVFDAFEQPHVKRAQLDTEVAKLARSLRRLFHPVLAKRSDAIHMATAMYHNCEELHTWDEAHLTPLDGRVQRRDGASLRILQPGPVLPGGLFALPPEAEVA